MTVESPTKSLTNEGPYSLDKITLPDAHIVNGREFPVAYGLNLHDQPYDQSKVEQLLKDVSQSGNFTKLLEDHATVVLRDTIKDSDDTKTDQVAEFIKIIEENRGHVEFQQNGTLGLRDLKAFNLYTASKAPAESRLLQHNEYSRFKKWPVTLIFTILEFTATGGETPLVHGGELYQHLERKLPDFLQKISKVGLKYQDEKWPKVSEKPGGLIWNHEVTFGRYIIPEDDLKPQKVKAEQVAKEYISDNFKWDENDDLLISSLATPVKKFKDEGVFFSSIAGFSANYSPEKAKIKYGNGDAFSVEEIAKFQEITDKLEYKHAWKSGDIVFVHNYQVSHGKFPYKDGKRSTSVGMWDEIEPKAKLQFVDYEL